MYTRRYNMRCSLYNFTSYQSYKSCTIVKYNSRVMLYAINFYVKMNINVIYIEKTAQR